MGTTEKWRNFSRKSTTKDDSKDTSSAAPKTAQPTSSDTTEKWRNFSRKTTAQPSPATDKPVTQQQTTQQQTGTSSGKLPSLSDTLTQGSFQKSIAPTYSTPEEFQTRAAERKTPTLGERVANTLSGAAKQYVAGLANASGLATTGQGGTFAKGSYEEQVQTLDEQLEALEATLKGGTLTPQQQKDTQEMIALVKQQRDNYANAVRSNKETGNAVYQLADEVANSGAQDIEYAKRGAGKLGQLAVDVGVAGAQMGGDIALGALTGGGALVPMFARSMGGSAQEARQEGSSHGQQVTYGIASGALSVATEKIANVAAPFKKAFGGGVLDKAIDGALAKMNGSAAGKLALSFLSEGGEEVVEDVVQPVLKSIYNGKSIGQNYSELELEEVLYDGLIGGILGGIGGGVELIGNRATRGTQTQNTPVVAPESAQERAETPQGETTLPTTENAPTAQETDGLELLRRAAEELNDGKRVNLADYATPENMSDISQGLNDGTLAVDALDRIYRTNESEHIDQRNSADMGSRTVNAFQFDHPELHQYYRETASELLDELGYSEKGGEIVHRTSRDAGDDEYFRTKRVATERIAQLLDGEGISYADIEKALNAIINNHGQENFAAAKRVELLLDDMLSNGYRSIYGETVAPNEDYIAAKQAIPGADTAETTREELPIWDMAEPEETVSRETVARNIAQVRDAATALGQNGSRALSTVYNETNAGNYAPETAVKDFYQVYNAALEGGSDNNTTAPDYIRMAAQNAGERDARIATQAKYFGKDAQLVRDEKWRKAKLTSKESYALDALAKVTGTQIRFADTVAEGRANANYSDGVITLALDAENPVMTSVVHETVHRIREAAPEMYQELSRFVLSNMSDTGLSFNQAVREEGYGADVDTLNEEIVADAFGVMLENSGVLEQFATQHRSAAQKLMDALHDLVVKIERALGSKEVRLSDNQKAAFRDLQGKVSEMETLFTEVLETTREKVGSKETRGAKNVQAKNSYAGENAKTADIAQLDAAKDLERQGVDNETIRQKTGWFKGMDGKWRFEIDDSASEFRKHGDAQLMKEPEYRRLQELTQKWADSYEKGGEALTEVEEDEMAALEERYADLVWEEKYLLRDFLHHDALFDAYPYLNRVSLSFEPLRNGLSGYFDGRSNTIVLSDNLIGSDKRTILHEVQHIIQKVEGFARGSSPEYWRKNYDAGKQENIDRIRSKIAALEEKLPAPNEKWTEAADGIADEIEVLEDRILQIENGALADGTELYRNTAGEIEARDTAARRDLTSEERRAYKPDLGDENTVFAGDGYSFASAEEQKSVKEQLQAFRTELNKMKPVATINDNGWSGMSVGEFRKKIIDDLRRTGYKVDRQGFGTIEFAEKELNSSLNYMTTNAEAAAYQCIPQVLKRGIEVSGHGNHKNRGYDTVTFAAPVVLNGKRGNMAVIVKKTKGNRYKVHRILATDGSAFVLPEMANAVSTSVGGFTEAAKSSGEVAPAINTASDKKISRRAGSVKDEERIRTQKYSLKEYTSEEQKQHVQDAISYFGKTYRWNETGYLTPNGTKLDFSGRHEGAPGGYRTVDHRDIRDALGDDYGGDDYSGSMVQFMSEGNIRISPESGGIDLSVMPTNAQMAGLSDFISKNRGEVILDIENENGQTVFSAEYPRGTHANKVLGDIKAYFEDGTMPQVSELAQFYTRDNYSLKTREALDEYIAQYGEIPAGETPHRRISIPRRTAENKYVSQTIRTVLEAKATPEAMIPTLEDMVAKGAFSYDRYTDKQAVSDAESKIKTRGWQKTLNQWKKTTKEEVSKEAMATGWALYNNAATSGDVETALEVLNDMVAKSRNAAQALQAVRLLKKQEPSTQLYGVQQSVESLQEDIKKRYGENAPELEVNRELAEKFLNAKTDEARTKAMGEIYRDIGRQMPSRFIDRWNAWRYLAMLGNPRTHARNIVGNAGFAPLVGIKNLIGTGLESAANTVSGGKVERTKAILTMKDTGIIKAAWNDYANIREQALGEGKYNESATMKKEIEEGRKIFGNTGNQLWDSTAGKGLEAFRRFNGAALDAEDMWFSKPHYAAALAMYCKANGITAEQITSGKGLEAARNYAIKEAQKATYRDTNDFSQMVSELGRYHGDSKAKKMVSVLLEGILPFRKTPANILARGVEYSPLGLTKAIVYDSFQVKQGKMEASEMLDHLSTGLTGTGVLALGVYMAKEGLLRGSGGDDEDKKDFDALRGHQDYALELADGTSVTLDWLAPEVLPLFVGANLYEQMQSNRNGEMTMSDVLEAVSNISDPLLEMSCLQSLNDLFDSVGYASSGDTSALASVAASAATSYLTQAIPTVFGQIERTGEDLRMTTYTDKNNKNLTGDMQYTLGKASAKIPGVEYNQIPYIDAWGRTESTGNIAQRAANNFLNPAYVSTVESSAMETELERLYEATGEAGVFPERADKYITVNGERKYLTGEEYVKYATEKGQTAYKAVSEIVKSEAYRALSDEDKAKLIGNAYSLANAAAKMSVSDYTPSGGVEKGAVVCRDYGIDPAQYIMLYAEQSGIESLKDSKGETISLSQGLLKMELIYQQSGLSDKQRAALFEAFNVPESIRHYNKALVAEKLKTMRRKAK